jgi:hypothetical protein
MRQREGKKYVGVIYWDDNRPLDFALDFALELDRKTRGLARVRPRLCP